MMPSAPKERGVSVRKLAKNSVWSAYAGTVTVDDENPGFHCSDSRTDSNLSTNTSKSNIVSHFRSMGAGTNIILVNLSCCC